MAGTDFSCLVNGCTRPVRSRGYYNAHYRRFLAYGDPLPDVPFQTQRGQPMHFLEKVVFAYECDECLLWPFAKGGSGHGLIYFDGRMCLVNRLVCKNRYGPAPSQRHHAAHNCGFAGCVNHRHLRWATPIENEADKILHGTDARGERNPRALLTSNQVREIVSLRGSDSQVAIAKRFGVSVATINNIYLGKSWKHICAA